MLLIKVLKSSGSLSPRKALLRGRGYLGFKSGRMSLSVSLMNGSGGYFSEQLGERSG